MVPKNIPCKYLLVRSLFIILFISGCSEEKSTTVAEAKSLNRESVCLLDGMILMDHPGPKGQITFKSGKTEYFCDIKGLFETLYNPEFSHLIQQVWVQDFGNRKWDSFDDNWIKIENAVFVFDSNKLGAMGPTIVPFLKQEHANNFIADAGGKLVQYGEINSNVIEEYVEKVSAQFRSDMGSSSNGNDHDHHKMHGHQH